MYKHFYHRKRRSGGTGARFTVLALAALFVGVFIGSVLKNSPEDKEKPALLPLVPESSPMPDALFVPSETSKPAVTEAVGTVALPSSELTVSVKGVPVEMELEDYLVGVVAAEMSVSSEPAALRAQAVAARTFTALHMQGRASCRSGCTVCDDHRCCQAYFSPDELERAWGEKYAENIEKIRSAVRSTEGLVVTFEGELISALYHASSGRATENSEEVFAVALPYLVSVDSFEGDSEMVSVQEFPLTTVVDKLNSLYPDAHLTVPLDEKDFDVWGRTDSGRVQLVRIGHSVITGSALRLALGLKSAAFTVEFDDDSITFTCLGYGHGVGMSQLGANEMAKDGAGFEEILAHFYTGTDLSRLTYGS